MDATWQALRDTLLRDAVVVRPGGTWLGFSGNAVLDFVCRDLIGR
jgi:hypothetical protein